MPVADAVILVADGFVYEGVDYAQRIEERLCAAGLACMRHDLTAGASSDLPPARGYVLTGGTTSVLSTAGWMKSAVDTAQQLVVRAVRGECTVVGICLGSQILAEALRPNSVIASEVIEVGLVSVSKAADAGVQQIVPAFHYQVISPEIASVSGTLIEWHNGHTAVQAFSHGERVYGCQFHPELAAEDVHSLIDYNKDVIAEWGGDPTRAHKTVDENAHSLSPDLFSRMITGKMPGAPMRR